MKKIVSLILLLAILAPMAAQNTVISQAASDEIRGTWVATVYAIDFPSTKSNIPAQKAELDRIVANAAKAKLNSIFFQVRPYGDALYKSTVYPWSEVLTGTAGKDPGFDPLAYIITAAKAKGIAIHAWINPYRLTVGSVTAPKHDINALPSNHPVRKNPSIAVAFDDGKLYLNPGEPAAQQLVLDGVKEIIQNYDVAGIHFDDYFYPSPSVTKGGKTYTAKFNDDSTYAKYGGGMSLADWRRSNTYKLIDDTNKLVKSLNKNVSFGVSPSGIWDNKKSNALGSDTNGFSSYTQIYADSRKWVKDGIIDYIAPQIYWQIGAKNSDYAKLVKWWSDVVSGTGVDLYIGHGAYRIEDWKDAQEIINQLELNKSYANVKGSIFYGYAMIEGNKLGLTDKLAAFYENKPVAPPIPPITGSLAQPATGLILSSPANNATTTAANSYIIGSGIPGKPIYMNGQLVPRTDSGHFALYVDLQNGANTFKFEHNGTTTNYVITKKTGSGGGSGGGTPAVVSDISAKKMVATTKNDYTTVRESNSSSSSRKTPLNKGFSDYILKETPTYYQLRYGGWVLKSDVTTVTAPLANNSISAVKGVRSSKTTTIKWKMPVGVPHTIREMVEGIEITFHNTQGRDAFKMAEGNPLFSAISFKQSGTDAIYTLTTKKERYLFGYEVQYKGGNVEIAFNHPLKLANSSKPLTGKVIHLDSGHGGTDPGATGPMGKYGPREYDLNMYVMLELKTALEALGAKIVTPNTDPTKTVSPEAREDSVRASGADIAISIHHNSVDTTANVGTISGTETLYTQPLSRRLAMTIQDSLIAATGNKDRGAKQQSLFMCRYEQLPTVLIEMGFVTNPFEYERLTSKAYISKQVNGIVNGVLAFMRD